MIRIKRHETVREGKSLGGSFEVRYDDGRESVFWYWDNEPSRRLRADAMDEKQALEAARVFARAERDGP